MFAPKCHIFIYISTSFPFFTRTSIASLMSSQFVFKTWNSYISGHYFPYFWDSCLLFLQVEMHSSGLKLNLKCLSSLQIQVVESSYIYIDTHAMNLVRSGVQSQMSPGTWKIWNRVHFYFFQFWWFWTHFSCIIHAVQCQRCTQIVYTSFFSDVSHCHLQVWCWLTPFKSSHVWNLILSYTKIEK